MIEPSKYRAEFYNSISKSNEEKIVLQPCVFLEVDELKECKYFKQIYGGFNYWLKLSDSKLQEIFLLNDLTFAELIIEDDIQDNTTMRCGGPSSHCVYGVPRTICASNYMKYVILEKLIQFENLKAIEVYTEWGKSEHKGVGMDLYFRDNFVCPTEEEYLKMVIGKTGSFVSLIVKLMQLLSDFKTDFTKLSQLIGIFIQLINDYANLVSEKYLAEKSFCEDLSEGKFSFPVIHAIRSKPDDDRIKNILKQRTSDMETKKYALSILEEFGSLDYTKQAIEKSRQDIVEEIRKIGDNPILVEALDVYYMNVCG